MKSGTLRRVGKSQGRGTKAAGIILRTRACEGYLACVAERLRSLPGGGAYYTLAVVLCLDRLVLEVDVLREVPHEREDFAHSRIHDAQGGKNIHDCARDGVGTLHRSISLIS
jgi:hypothetical protein